MSNTTEEQIQELALRVNEETGTWKYGRRAIKFLLPEASMWKIRRILEEMRKDDSRLAPTSGKPLQSKSIDTTDRLQIIVNVPNIPLVQPKTNQTTEVWVLGSDFHASYHHESSCSIFYQIINDLQPNKVILLGDVINLDQFSKYDHDPTGPTWAEELASAGLILGSIKQAAPNAELQWRKGNHEGRLQKYLMRHDPILYEHFNIAKLFMLTSNGQAIEAFNWFKYIDQYEESFNDLNLILVHGELIRKHAGMSAQAEIDKQWMSVVMGHTHRIGIYNKSSGRSRFIGDRPVFGMEIGCLCNYDLPYMNGTTSNWQHGFGILTIDRSDPLDPFVEPEIIRIGNKKALFRGKIYTA